MPPQMFADLLNQHLYTLDRSPSWLARQLGVSPSTVSRWLNEESRPKDPETVGRIADILAVHERAEREALLAAAGYSYWESPRTDLPLPVPNPAVSQEDVPQIPPFTVPALPPQGILGRGALIARLTDLLVRNGRESADPSPIALQGMGGIGKTTLAIALGHQEKVSHLFPDGVLWAAVGPDPTIRNLLDSWGRALGISLVAERNEEACQERLRSILRHRRMLLLIDDVWEVEHGNYFLVGGPHCRTIFTTRESPVAYTLATRARTLRVDVLEPDDALALLDRLAPEAVRAAPTSARRLCARLEYLPLALTLAGRLLANEADVPSRMQRLVGELMERREARLHLLQTEGRLGLDPAEPASLQAILGMSVDRLSKVDQERFALLALFGAEPLTWEMEAAAYVWECSRREAETTVAQLIQRGLVMRRGNDYWMHALLADYAAEMLGSMR